MKLKAQEVADLVGGIVDGDKKSTITKLSKIENGVSKSLSFLEILNTMNMYTNQRRQLSLLIKGLS